MQSIKVIFDRFIEDSAMLITESGKQIFWPRDKFSEDLQPGQILYLTLNNSPDKTESTPQSQPKTEPTNDQKKMAKTILEEILNSSEQESLE